MYPQNKPGRRAAIGVNIMLFVGAALLSFYIGRDVGQRQVYSVFEKNRTEITRKVEQVGQLVDSLNREISLKNNTISFLEQQVSVLKDGNSQLTALSKSAIEILKRSQKIDYAQKEEISLLESALISAAWTISDVKNSDDFRKFAYELGCKDIEAADVNLFSMAIGNGKECKYGRREINDEKGPVRYVGLLTVPITTLVNYVSLSQNQETSANSAANNLVKEYVIEQLFKQAGTDCEGTPPDGFSQLALNLGCGPVSDSADTFTITIMSQGNKCIYESGNYDVETNPGSPDNEKLVLTKVVLKVPLDIALQYLKTDQASCAAETEQMPSGL